MALRTRIDDGGCAECDGPWLVVEHRTHTEHQWDELSRSCLRRCAERHETLADAS